MSNFFTVSPIGNDEFLIEGNIDKARFVTETDLTNISLVDIINGPKLIVGKDFLGYGNIDHISLLRNNPSKPLLLKIRTTNP